MLPQWVGVSKNHFIDISGLMSGHEKTPVGMQKVVRNRNTDQMRIVSRQVYLHTGENLPVLRGNKVNVKHYKQDLLNGFTALYRFFVAHKKEWLHPQGVLQRFEGLSVRYIFRPTNIYHKILQASLKPEHLQDGAERSLQLEMLSRAYFFPDEKRFAWSIQKKETDDMEYLDVPYLRVSTSADRLQYGEEEESVEPFFQSSFQAVKDKIMRLNERDLELQTKLIKGSLYAREAGRSEHDAGEKRREKEGKEVGSEPNQEASDAVVDLRIVERMAREMQAQAIVGEDESVTWIGNIIRGNVVHFAPMDHPLYDGHCGLSLFFAALYKVTGHTDHKEWAKRTLQDMRSEFHQYGLEYMVRRMGIGGFTGIGSIIYSLTRVGTLLGDGKLIEEALNVANRVSSELIESSRQYDVMSGTAGLLLAFAALFEASKAESVLDKAAACGEHLLRNRVKTPQGYEAWPTHPENRTALTGFSHGAAGIAYALTKLYALTGKESYVTAARKAVLYEDSFLEKGGIWPDLRYPDREKGLLDSWCHGAAGIGLARAASESFFPDPLWTNGKRRALEYVSRGTGTRDHLCCGDMGKIEFLLYVSCSDKRTDVRNRALQRAYERAEGYRKAGRWRLPVPVRNYGFFQGLAGIGYELLRVSHPEKLNSAAILE